MSTSFGRFLLFGSLFMFVDAVWRNGFDGPPPDKVGRDFQGNTWVTLTSPEVERFYNEQTDRDRKKQEVENSRRANGWAPGG